MKDFFKSIGRPKDVPLTQYICFIGLFSALGTVLDAYLTVPLFSSWMRVTFGFVSEAVSAVLLGGGAAIITATLTDIFSTLLRGEEFSVLFMWLAVLQGIIVGLTFNRKLTLKRIIVSRVLVNLIVNLWLHTWALDIIGWVSWRVRLPLQLVKVPLVGVAEIIVLSLLLPIIVNSVKQFGFKDVAVEDNISIRGSGKFKQRLGFSAVGCIYSISSICMLMLPVVTLTQNGQDTFSYFSLFDKLFNGEVVISTPIRAIMFIPVLLVAVCFILSFYEKPILKIMFGLLSALSLPLVLNYALKPHLASIVGVSADFAPALLCIRLFAALLILYSATALLQKTKSKY